MADSMSMQQLMEQAGGNEAAARQGKATMSIQRQLLSYQKMGLDPADAILLVKAQHGLITQEDLPKLQRLAPMLMRMGQINQTPGAAKGLRSWPPGATNEGEGTRAAREVLRSLGIGGDSGMSLQELMQQ